MSDTHHATGRPKGLRTRSCEAELQEVAVPSFRKIRQRETEQEKGRLHQETCSVLPLHGGTRTVSSHKKARGLCNTGVAQTWLENMVACSLAAWVVTGNSLCIRQVVES